MGMSLNQLLHRLLWNGLGLMVLVAPLAIGSVHWPVRIVLATVAGGLLLVSVLLHLRRRQRLRFDGFAILALGMMALMGFQLLEIGDGLLAWLSPVAMESVTRARELGYEVAARLSLDPVATVGQLSLAGTCLALYLVAFNLAHRETTGHKLLGMVGIGGAVVALITVIHFVAGSKLVLGFYAPEQGLDQAQFFFSTFVNNNHGAGFLNLALFILVGQWQKAQFGREKGLFAAMVLLTAAASVSMLSRGGLLALLSGGLLLTLLGRVAAGRKTAPTYALTVLGVLGAAIAAALFLMVYDRVLGSVENTRLFPVGEIDGKVFFWEKVRGMMGQFSTLGAGAGAFGAAFAPHNQLEAGIFFPHAENEILEPLIEYGRVAGTAFLVVVVGLFWRRAPFAFRDGHYAGALVGLFALGIQNVADYSLRIPGVAIPATVALGALGGAFARERERRTAWRLRISAMQVAPLAVCAFFALLLGSAWVPSNDLRRAHRTVVASLGSASAGPEDFELGLGSSLLTWHHHDGHLYSLLGRRRELRQEPEKARALHQRALELAPIYSAPRLGLARVARTMGESEEFLRLLLGLHQTNRSIEPLVFDTLVHEGPSVALLVSAWREDPEVLRRLIRYLHNGRWNVQCIALSREFLRVQGPDITVLNYLGMAQLARDEFDEADATATKLMGLFPESHLGFLLQARVDLRRGESTEALMMYEETVKRRGETDVMLSLEMMELLARLRRWDQFEGIASGVRLTIGQDREHRARFHLLMATREEMRGEYFAALSELDQAELSAPFNVQVPLRKAKLQLLLGRAEKAVPEYRKALKIEPENQAAAQGLRELENAGPGRDRL